MEEKTRCQSCGMRLSDEFPVGYGSEADGAPALEYCMFCYKEGAFTKPDQTVDEMIQMSVDFMTTNLGFSREQASQMSNDVISKLKRWQ